MRLGCLGLALFAACAHAPGAGSGDELVHVAMWNTLDRDVCVVHLWSDEEGPSNQENRLMPGAPRLLASSPFRLHRGERRDFAVPAQAPLRMEAVDCTGQLVESRELPARPGSVVRLTLSLASR